MRTRLWVYGKYHHGYMVTSIFCIQKDSCTFDRVVFKKIPLDQVICFLGYEFNPGSHRVASWPYPDVEGSIQLAETEGYGQLATLKF